MEELRTGQHVEVRDEPWIVVSAEAYEAVALVTLQGVGVGNLGETERVLAPFDRVRAVRISRRPVPRPRDRVLRRAAKVLASSPAWHECWTAGAAGIEIRGWQLEPAMAAVRGASRILLADEVGLGKTIQAALILSELTARGLASRALVLTPASLRAQWASELSDRFGICAAVFDHASLAARSGSRPPEVNPWTTAAVVISSIDLVKRPEVRTALDEAAFDVLVVDEAHHLTPGTERGALVSDLASRTPWVVLATATPHSGDEAAYEFLCSLGRLDGDPGIALYRRSSPRTRGPAPRRVVLLGVTPDAAERALLDATLAYCQLLGERARLEPGVELVASVIARRAASSPAAAHRTIARRLALVRGERMPEAQPPLPWDEGDPADAELPDAVLALPGLASPADEAAWLERLVGLAAATPPISSKVHVIRRLVRRTAEPLIVFSEYRDVVLAVAGQLHDLTGVTVIHGGLSGAIRRERINAFTSGAVRALVTTDAAGEGVNLQARCRLVVNLELPWSPLRLEQRIGRVDRIGQTRRVHAIHLFHRGSFEDVVRARADSRLARMPAATGEPSAADASFPEIERRLRRVIGTSAGRESLGPPVFARRSRRSRPPCRLILLYAANVHDAMGRLVRRVPAAIALSLDPRGRHRGKLSKAAVLAASTDRRVLAAVHDELSRATDEAGRATAVAAVAFESRLQAIQRALRAERRETTVQASLFDRRAEREATRRDESSAALRAHVERRARIVRALGAIRADSPRLVAAWLEE